ncbi:prepilin peptidase [Falsibacillus albus]|uniref:Prepilin peptidase n=1 Tax=Falsibacillus albus TaxID=2478915 RepID=A0A3L7K7B8_9BACI|nr:A24 family peptidase [Falsibacillus albus]RLQ98051.1 prepilin peptidase [Falsibacillus albus]
MGIILFLYGLLLGSFYNVVGLRVPEKKSIVKPRSACPNCGHTLRPIELIPVLSYVIQGGKCSQCSGCISPLYPFMELAAGLLFVYSYEVFGLAPELLIALTLVSMLIIIFVSDIKYMIIPDKILLVFGGIFIVERLLLPLSPWWDSLVGAVVAFALLLLIAIVSNGAMGGGDIKLFALLGFVLGVKLVLLSFFLATLIGAVVGIIGLAIGIFERKKPIPFGPYIVAGTLAAYFFHYEILRWYFSLIL